MTIRSTVPADQLRQLPRCPWSFLSPDEVDGLLASDFVDVDVGSEDRAARLWSALRNETPCDPDQEAQTTRPPELRDASKQVVRAAVVFRGAPAAGGDEQSQQFLRVRLRKGRVDQPQRVHGNGSGPSGVGQTVARLLVSIARPAGNAARSVAKNSGCSAVGSIDSNGASMTQVLPLVTSNSLTATRSLRRSPLMSPIRSLVPEKREDDQR